MSRGGRDAINVLLRHRRGEKVLYHPFSLLFSIIRKEGGEKGSSFSYLFALPQEVRNRRKGRGGGYFQGEAKAQPCPSSTAHLRVPRGKEGLKRRGQTVIQYSYYAEGEKGSIAKG